MLDKLKDWLWGEKDDKPKRPAIIIEDDKPEQFPNPPEEL